MCPCKHFSHEAGRQRRRRNEGLAKRSKCLSMVSVWQAVSVLVIDELHAFGEISAEPRYIALLVDLFTATLQAAPISITRFFPTLFGSAALQAFAQP